MDRYFKITANDAGANHEIILKEINAFQAVDNVNMNVDFIAKVVECDERGQELNTGEKQCNLPVISQQRELLLAMFDLSQTMPDDLTKADKMKVVDKFIANNCG